MQSAATYGTDCQKPGRTFRCKFVFHHHPNSSMSSGRVENHKTTCYDDRSRSLSQPRQRPRKKEEKIFFFYPSPEKYRLQFSLQKTALYFCWVHTLSSDTLAWNDKLSPSSFCQTFPRDTIEKAGINQLKFCTPQ